MTEILFYHLQGQKLERIAALLEVAGARLVLWCGVRPGASALDAHLWTTATMAFSTARGVSQNGTATGVAHPTTAIKMAQPFASWSTAHRFR
jgi:DNA polymerase IIIc chi subunit